jgi:ribosomal-protein-alanine N-acetyltransferase
MSASSIKRQSSPGTSGGFGHPIFFAYDIRVTHENKLEVRLAAPDDASHLQSLDNESGHPVGKSAEDYLNISDGHMRRIVLITRVNDHVAGFLVARVVGDEWEIENVSVSPAYRQRGLGVCLVDDLLTRARAEHASAIHLEVRGSNAHAIALYRKSGFSQTGFRQAYYSDPEEDALLFSYSFKNSS